MIYWKRIDGAYELEHLGFHLVVVRNREDTWNWHVYDGKNRVDGDYTLYVKDAKAAAIAAANRRHDALVEFIAEGEDM